MSPAAVDFQKTPYLVIWETTQACDLICVHCRATAEPDPKPGELSHDEGLTLMDEVARMGTKVLILSGGDPLKRKDLLELVRHGKSRGLRLGTIPAATPLLAKEVVRQLKEAGLDQMALSLDGSTEESHDRFRGTAGAFQKTMEAARWARDIGLPLQINTVIARRNFHEVDALMERVRSLGIVFWEIFFLVPVGRGAALEALAAKEVETVFSKLYQLSKRESFIIKITEAPHYRRYVLQEKMEEGTEPKKIRGRKFKLPIELRRELGIRGSIGQPPQGVNAGKGFVFVAHDGEVFPSGFLPLSAGNVRDLPLGNIYRDSPLFVALRDPELLKGRCGVCEYREVCGGSRSRAHALTGDYLAEDSTCCYQPLLHQNAGR
ncbi:MAG: TIGR04053 family radical SAM/SPASM domain-containing protein [Candidatus Omnitrophota bacterium]